MGYLLAALGGAAGALGRWAVAAALPPSPGGWPWATLLVNLAGCFLIGALLAALELRVPVAARAWVQPAVGVGVLGGFTTWSAFALETVLLVEQGAVLLAAGYVAASVLGGVLAVAAGAAAVPTLSGRAAR